MRGLIRELAADGTTVLVSSHLLAEIEQVATHVGIMSAGRLLRQGSLDEVLGETAATCCVSTPANRRRQWSRLRKLGLSIDSTAADHVLVGLGGLEPEDINAALVKADVPVRGLRVERPLLEDLFVQLTGEGFDVVR